MPITISVKEKFPRTCIYCGKNIVEQTLLVRHPLLAFLGQTSQELDIKIISSKDLATRSQACTKSEDSKHKINDHDFLGINL